MNDFEYNIGVVDKLKLISLCLLVGLTQSLCFLQNNSDSVMTLISPGGYDPTLLLGDIAPYAEVLDITGMHCFTFNSTVNTVQWVNDLLKEIK